jgi:hypothetical protein
MTHRILSSQGKSHILFTLALCSALLFTPAVKAAHHDNEPGFKSLFNGKTLKGWDGVDRFWRVEGGAIVGQTTEDNKTEKNTFLIYRDGNFGNFELRFQFQVEGGNSGVQYRSEDIGNHVMKGLQADFEPRWHVDKKDPSAPPSDRFTGMFFEENGRMFMGQRGDVVIVRANPENPKKPRIEKIGSVGDAAELEKVIHRDGWNDYTVIADGNKYIHMVNGVVLSIGIDEDELNFKKDGLLGFQLHAGVPIKIQVKNIRIREL